MLDPVERNYLLKTLGCKANLCDSQLIENELHRRGWKRYDVPRGQSKASGVLLCVVNTCTVTDEADRQSRRLAGRLARENPSAVIVVTGCAAEVDPERLASTKGIHYIIGNRDKSRLVELILEKLEVKRDAALPVDGEMLSRHPIDRGWPGSAEAFPDLAADGGDRSVRTRAFFKIQEGCNAFCTYCIIPYGRGPSRSLTQSEVVKRIKGLVAGGMREVVITGTNIGDYGFDLTSEEVAVGRNELPLTELIKLILNETGVERLRLSSLDPTEITPALLQIVERDSRFCPHFHVSLQSPDSRVLRLMKRKYGFAQVQDCLERIAAVRTSAVGGPFVGMDVITGFPGESAADFERGFEALSVLPWTRLHVFPYSEREGTPATRLPGVVPMGERVRRARELNRLSLERMKTHYVRALECCRGQGGTLSDILLERAGRMPRGLGSDGDSAAYKWVGGYTGNYLRVFIRIPERRIPEGMSQVDLASLQNRIVSARPQEIAVDIARGDVVMVADPIDVTGEWRETRE